MPGLLLRLSGPLQSWGEHSTFDRRDTARHPTRSAIIGLLAAAEGVPRHTPPDRYAPLTVTIRVDRPGQHLTDYHTIGGGDPQRTAPSASDGRPKGSPIQTWRTYLTDATFTAAITGPETLIADLAQALRKPTWQPYLGRRSCPTDGPLLLATAHDPEAELRALPLARKATWKERADGTISIEFISEQHTPGAPVTALNDQPVDFHPLNRTYRNRNVYSSHEPLPASLAAGYGAAYLHALHQHLTQTKGNPR